MKISISDKILDVYAYAETYPQLVSELIEIGILSYSVEIASGTILYRLKNGENIIHHNARSSKRVAENFDETLTVQAIRDNQAGKSDYPGFINAIAKAGVRFYEATLNGKNKRVTYIGIGGLYEEEIPVK